MSLFCGRKSKKQKRSSSPSYGSKEEASEEKARLIRQTERLKEVEEETQRLKENLKDEQNKYRVSRQENADLKQELKHAKSKQDSNKATEVTPGSPIPDMTKLENIEIQVLGEKKWKPAIDEEKARLSKDLQIVKKEIVNERQKGEERVEQLNEDLKKANKALETERNTGETKANKLSEELKQARNEAESEKKERAKAEEEREKFKREKDAAENKLAHTSKELEIAKKESHIPRSPTRIPTDEWKAKIDTAETELNKERQQRLDKERENSRLVNDKDSIEKEKLTLQAEIQNLTTTKEKEFADIKTTKEEELESQRKNLEMNHKNDTKRLEDMIDDMKNKLATADAEKEKLLTRLSSQTAAQVLDNNPNVSDLSDPNRPQKLGEQLAQVYDDQWTDATEALEKISKSEEDILKTLLDIIVAIYTHCKEAAESQLSKIEEDLFLPPLENTASESADTNGTEHLKSPTSSTKSMSKIPRFTSHKGRPTLPNISTEKKTVDNDNSGARDKDKPKRSLSFPRVKGERMPEIPTEVRKGIKEYRKKITKQVWPVIEKEVISKLRKNEEFGDSVIDACKAYITKCVELCWLMRVQDPPVSLAWDVPDDKSLNTDVYRAYTKSGTHVEYVVWPAMYLYEDGPILMKGVAQGIKQ